MGRISNRAKNLPLATSTLLTSTEADSSYHVDSARA